MLAGVGEGIVPCPTGAGFGGELDFAGGGAGSHEAVADIGNFEETAGPGGGVAEEIGIEADGSFVVVADFDGDGLGGGLARGLDGEVEELADIGFGPAVIDPIGFGEGFFLGGFGGGGEGFGDGAGLGGERGGEMTKGQIPNAKEKRERVTQSAQRTRRSQRGGEGGFREM